MQISPRYDGPPIIELDGEPSAVGVPLVRQRRRLAETLRTLTDDQWEAPSRCAEWRVQDVVAHLVSVDQFWNFSVVMGLAGTPTRVLAEFDPKATPAALVDAAREQTPAETLATYVDACEAFCTTIESLDADGWRKLAESPAGHVSITAIAHHALWDCWVHERDILTPLGMTQPEEADEIIAGLRYAAALSPGFVLQAGGAIRAGALVLDVTDPDARIVVDVHDHVHVHDGDATPDGAFTVRGNAVELLDAFSVRAALPIDVPAEHEWLVGGLRQVFETAG